MSEPDNAAADFFVIVEGHGGLNALVDPAAYGAAAEQLDVVSLYTPYQ